MVLPSLLSVPKTKHCTSPSLSFSLCDIEAVIINQLPYKQDWLRLVKRGKVFFSGRKLERINRIIIHEALLAGPASPSVAFMGYPCAWKSTLLPRNNIWKFVTLLESEPASVCGVSHRYRVINNTNPGWREAGAGASRMCCKPQAPRRAMSRLRHQVMGWGWWAKKICKEKSWQRCGGDWSPI